MDQLSLGRLGPLPEFLTTPSDDDVVATVTPAGDKMWLVRDYALGRQVLTDKRFSRAEAVKPGAPQVIDAQPVPDSITSMDGLEHARLRRVVTGAFTSGRVAALRPAVESLVDTHLDAMAAEGPGTDLIEGLATPLPLAVLCTLLGIPPGDTSAFRDWVEVLFDISASSPKEKARRRLELATYMADLVADKRRSPEDDLLTVMIAATDRGELSANELLTLGLALLMAGYETTSGQIGLSMLSLLRDPEGYAEVRDHPERLATVTEELLRLTPATPVSFPRVATEPVSLGNAEIAAGDGVMISLLHSNRDGKAFTDPETVELEKRSAVHLTFGHGVHRCIGAPLARLQLHVVLERLPRRFPALRLAADPGAVVWKDGLGTRGLSRLAVEW